MSEAFTSHMATTGLHTRERIIADGRLHRFTVDGDRPRSRNGWYILFGDGVAAGAFGSWKTGERFTWCAKADNDLTPAERAEYRRRMEDARKAREAEQQEQRRQARDKAASIWQQSPLAPQDHPYLVKKRVGSHGLRLYKSALVIPLRDDAGTLHSLQLIDGEGNKRFLSGGRVQGCYFSIGNPNKTLCIAEGYATAATIHELTGHAAAVAFNAGNLEAVAKALREKFPDTEIIICADNDVTTPGNPGLTKARKAASAIGALLAVPPCAGDFNDLMCGVAQ